MTTYILSFGDHLKAMAMRQEGAGWAEIAKVMQIPADRLRRLLDPSYERQYQAKLRQRNREIREATANKRAIKDRVDTIRHPIAQSLLDAREQYREELERRDLTGQFCGDPAFSRSALNRKPVGAFKVVDMDNHPMNIIEEFKE